MSSIYDILDGLENMGLTELEQEIALLERRLTWCKVLKELLVRQGVGGNTSSRSIEERLVRAGVPTQCGKLVELLQTHESLLVAHISEVLTTSDQNVYKLLRANKDLFTLAKGRVTLVAPNAQAAQHVDK